MQASVVQMAESDGHADFDETILITNPGSRSGDEGAGSFADVLQTLGPLHIYRTDQADSIEETIRSLANERTRVVIGGGDGSINWLLDSVIESGATLGVLPLGTANDFARSLGLSDNPEEALDVIVAGHRRRVDVGKLNGKTFLNAAGIGIGPAMTRELSADKKSRLGVFAYLAALIAVVRRSDSFTARLVVDDVPHRLRCLQITIANGIHYGGGMTIADTAELDDGLLHVLCVRRQSPLKLLGKFFALRWGDLRGATDLSLYTGSRISLSTRAPMDVTADGEMVTKTPLDCESLTGVLPVFAPAPDDGEPAE